MRAGSFIGDTRQGGSCNASELNLNPHCHGTHTECLGHVVDRRVHIMDVAPSGLLSAQLISLPALRPAKTTERLPRAARKGDQILTLDAVRQALGGQPLASDALIVRTLPNPAAKRNWRYTDSGDYPYFSVDAMCFIRDAGVQHLLIDTPSLDRLDDDGALELHRIFWCLSMRGRRVSRGARMAATVTEMIYVDDKVSDGAYWLSLQPAPFSGDASPSNPVIFAKESSL